ncbi:MAG: hypothetical protein R2697_03070 [Ilumatobacteraceae bacterium]
MTPAPWSLSHESLAYFADRYDFEIVGTVIPSMSTMAETNAADLAESRRDRTARCGGHLHRGEMSSAADAEALADRFGVTVVPLVTDSSTIPTPTCRRDDATQRRPDRRTVGARSARPSPDARNLAT